MMSDMFDKVIIGAGLYGLYAALFCAKRGEKVMVLEHDSEAFSRATYVNQARVHMGYHYPRSYSTAKKSAEYFHRFNEDFGFCINRKFKKIYATSSKFSWTNAQQFEKFCKAVNIACDRVPVSNYFNKDMCDGAFVVEEYTYDAKLLRDFYLRELGKYSNVSIAYQTRINRIIQNHDVYEIYLDNGIKYRAGFVLNASYASVNQIIDKVEGKDFKKFKIKYELCEIILCKADDQLKNLGITVMDGPFFSIMPFGKTGLHSLTSVTFTPHKVSFDEKPEFKCQELSGGTCNKNQLGNCNLCPAKPETAYTYMSNLARKYLKDEFKFEYDQSLFSMKPILVDSEIDDSRPTVIRVHATNPAFVSVLSGKINTVYDLDHILI